MRTKKKKENLLSSKVLPITLIGILFIGGLVYFLTSRGTQEYYKIESRISNVENFDNPDTNDFEAIGWLRVQGTDLDMPIMHSSTADYSYPVEFDNYVWTINEKPFSNNMMVLSGHNIMNLSTNPQKKAEYFKRFEELMSFVYYDFAKENKYFQITLDGHDYLYKIFAVNFIPYVDFLYFPAENNHTKKEFKEYVDYLKEYSMYDYSVDVNEDDKVVTLSTCTRFFGQEENVDFYVTGRLVRKDEKVGNYKVEKNSYYDEVLKIMKDGENNEEDV